MCPVLFIELCLLLEVLISRRRDTLSQTVVGLEVICLDAEVLQQFGLLLSLQVSLRGLIMLQLALSRLLSSWELSVRVLEYVKDNILHLIFLDGGLVDTSIRLLRVDAFEPVLEGPVVVALLLLAHEACQLGDHASRGAARSTLMLADRGRFHIRVAIDDQVLQI